MDKSTHLQMATRIHFALLRQFGENIEIGDLIKNQGDAREALWVCEASDDLELRDLARQFKACSQALAEAATKAEKTAAKGSESAASPWQSGSRANPQVQAHAYAQPFSHPIGRPLGRVPSPPSRKAPAPNTQNLDLSQAPGLDPAPPPVVRTRMLPPSWFRRAAPT